MSLFLHFYLAIILLACNSFTETPLRNTILLYKDDGVSTGCFQASYLYFVKKGYTVIEVNATILQETEWMQNCEQKILLIPGGADRPYHLKLKGVGCSNIKSFVHDGGVYLGICAGSYFGCKTVAFDIGLPDEILEERELQFFPGVAFGPVLLPYSEGTESGASAANITLNDGSTAYVYHNGGPTFLSGLASSSLPGVEVLARYADVDNKPAIIRCSYGQGYAILSAVHFEFTPEYIHSQADQTDEEIYHLLISTNDTVDAFINTLFPTLKA